MCYFSFYEYSSESLKVILHGELMEEPLWGRIMIKLSHLLLTLSSALNIIIYSYNAGYPARPSQI